MEVDDITGIIINTTLEIRDLGPGFYILSASPREPIFGGKGVK
jgi:hypothetical protein